MVVIVARGPQTGDKIPPLKGLEVRRPGMKAAPPFLISLIKQNTSI